MIVNTSRKVTAPEARVLTYEEAIKAEYCVMETRDGHELHQFVHDDMGYYSPSINSCDRPYFEQLVTAGEDQHQETDRA